MTISPDYINSLRESVCNDRTHGSVISISSDDKGYTLKYWNYNSKPGEINGSAEFVSKKFKKLTLSQTVVLVDEISKKIITNVTSIKNSTPNDYQLEKETEYAIWLDIVLEIIDPFPLPETPRGNHSCVIL